MSSGIRSPNRHPRRLADHHRLLSTSKDVETRVKAARITLTELQETTAGSLVGSVLLAQVRTERSRYSKGTVLDEAMATDIRDAAVAGALSQPLSLAWPGPGDLHEDEAARRLARAVAGPGIIIGRIHQSRIDLLAEADGVLQVRTDVLEAVNTIDPLEVFTLFDGQAVAEGQSVAGVKVAPHLVDAGAIERGESLAGDEGLVVLRRYQRIRVAAVAAHPEDAAELDRFAAAADLRVTALCGTLDGTFSTAADDPDSAADELQRILEDTLGRGVGVFLVGGVSAGDPLAPFFTALERLDGRIIRRGAPAHPGSMVWLAVVRDAVILGLPRCGMFSMATAADMIFPRLMAGEHPTPATLAGLGHGGLLQADMRFRLPPYARSLSVDLED